jgi:AcrR family transcriptional regulator
VIHFFAGMPYRPTERTEARKAATRERIAQAAHAQVAEGGYASASVKAVARRAGVATGSVYRHFPSKADLFAEVFRRASQRELDLVTAIAAGNGGRPPLERIALAVEAFSRRALAGPVLAYALVAEPVDPAVEAERLAFRRGYRDAFARALEDGIAAGEVEPCDVETVAAALVGALAEALVGPLSAMNGGAPPRRRREALVAGLVQFCLNAIRPPPAARRSPSKEEARVPRPAHA